MRVLAAFLRFWWDFLIGDDWRIAAGVALVLCGGALLVSHTDASDALVATVTALGMVLVAIGSIFASALRARR